MTPPATSNSSGSGGSNGGGSSSSGGSSSITETPSGGGEAPSLPTNASVLDYAYSKIGYPYVWGGKGPDEFDCSGFVAWCYRQIGISLPSYTESLYARAKARFSPGEAQPGDVLYKPATWDIHRWDQLRRGDGNALGRRRELSRRLDRRLAFLCPLPGTMRSLRLYARNVRSLWRAPILG